MTRGGGIKKNALQNAETPMPVEGRQLYKAFILMLIQ